MNDVIPAVTGARVYAVRSKSSPGHRQIVDLSRATCTCAYSQFQRGTDRICEHQRLAVEFEAEQRELQEKMPVTVSRLKTQVTEKPHLPRVPEMSEDELKGIFA